jgi:hypothetical protein
VIISYGKKEMAGGLYKTAMGKKSKPFIAGKRH